ncbi:hypothetical protein CLOM_g12938, partial [Closterium sp. NIES-68]
LIPASDTWGVWAALLVAAAIGFWSERHTDLGRALSGPLVATLVGLAASNLGLIPCEAPAYNVVNRFLLPLAVPLLLFAADLRRVIKDTGRLLLAFCVGAVGTIFGTLVAYAALPLRSLGGDGWKIAAALMSRHIGGAVNYVAVTEALQASPSVVTAALAADNLLCALYFTTLFALAAKIPAEPISGGSSSGGSGAANISPDSQAPPSFDVSAAATALALSASLCWLGSVLARSLHFTGGTIPCVTALVLAFATITPGLAAPLVAPGEKMAALMLQVFFASVGANGSLSSVLSSAPSLFLFILLQLSLHLLLTLSLGRLLSFPLKPLLIASNANVGGPTTAAGMAAAKGWRSLTVPAVLVGIFGYATATFLSVVIGHTVLKPMHLKAVLS